jgi:protein-disulfide isomerase
MGDERLERQLFERRARAMDPEGVPSLASVLRAADAGRQTRQKQGMRSARSLASATVVVAAAGAIAAAIVAIAARQPSGARLIAADMDPSADGRSTRRAVVPSAPRSIDRGGAGAGDAPATSDAVETVPVDGAPSRGSARASITIVEFADFQCPFCARAELVLRALELTHPGDVRLVFKNLPLPMHRDARIAAKAALAADAQGHFWEFHDRLFAQFGGPLDRSMLERIAADLRLDLARFSRDLDDPAIEARIAKDEKDADVLGVEGVPTFYVNGRRLNGAQPIAVFEAVIARAGAK